MAFSTHLSKWHQRQGNPDGLKARPIKPNEIPAWMSRSRPAGLVPRVMTTLSVEMMGDVSVEVYWADVDDVKDELEAKLQQKLRKATQSDQTRA